WPAWLSRCPRNHAARTALAPCPVPQPYQKPAGVLLASKLISIAFAKLLLTAYANSLFIAFTKLYIAHGDFNGKDHPLPVVRYECRRGCKILCFRVKGRKDPANHLL